MLHRDFSLCHPSSTLYPSFTKTPVKHATQIRAIFAKKKVAHGYSDSGAVVNLISSDWRGGENNNTTSQKTALSFLGLGWALVGGGLWDQRFGVGGVFFNRPPQSGDGKLHYAVVGTDTSSRRLFLRLQDTLLPFLGAPWMNLTHTLSCLNCTRNLPHKNIIVKHHPGGRRIVFRITGFYCVCALTRLRCRCRAARCLRPWPRCGGVWWWSRSDVHCWVRSLLWRLRPTPEAK